MRASVVLRLLPSLALLGLLSACTPEVAQEDDAAEQEQALVAAQQAADSAAEPPPPADTDAPPTCDASQVQGLIGQAVDDARAEQARTDAGADKVRILKPGEMVTMEFDGARLNIEVDDAGTITSVRCG
ncbi:I78 family peptidase inhibitor [Pseudoxanthomonas suwonensis]|uniref:I78 family peptidase inhibitor n=1 Tax=Pseudoxanthomonas suwonensis TaxID=314722 RepID=UPI0004665716|nr:I78 family peptidase inhibitor [Pseudoxanthomonas suwonensis]